MNLSDNGHVGEDVPAATSDGDPVRIPIRIRHEDNDGGIVPVDDNFAGDAGTDTAALLLPAVNQVREFAHRTSGDEYSLIEESFVFRDLTDGDDSSRSTDDLIVSENFLTTENTDGIARSEATALASGQGGVAQVDYDDDGDLDLYVIQAPGGDNALLVNDPIGDFANSDAPSGYGLLLPAVQGAREAPPLPSAFETVDDDFATADTFVFASTPGQADSAVDMGHFLIEFTFEDGSQDTGGGVAKDVVQADWPEPEADAIPIGDGCAMLDSGAIVCLL